MIKRLCDFARNNWFLLALCAVLLVGSAFAHALEPLVQATWLRNSLVAVVLFVTTLPVSLDGIKRTIRSPWAAILACGVSWVLIPLLTIPWARWMSGPFGLGLLVAASSPGTLASAAVWTRKAGGNELIPIAVTLITNPISCFVIPFWLSFGTSDIELGLSPWAMMAKLAVLVVLPMALAQIARRRPNVASWTNRHKQPLSVLAQCGILTIVMIGAIQCGLQVDSAGVGQASHVSALWQIVPIVTGIHVMAVAVACVISRLLGFVPGDRIGIAFAGSQKTLMVGIQVAFLLGGGVIIIPMVAYHFVQLVVDAWLANRWSLQARVEGHPV